MTTESFQSEMPWRGKRNFWIRQGHLVLRAVDENQPKERRCMIAGANVRSMGGLKSTFMGFSFSAADAFRRSLIKNDMLLPHGVPK